MNIDDKKQRLPVLSQANIYTFCQEVCKWCLRVLSNLCYANVIICVAFV